MMPRRRCAPRRRGSIRRRPGWRGARWRARSSGSVQQIYYRAGELVPAGKPIVALLPPGNIKVRFFVNEATLPKLTIGDRVTVACDGCASGITAKISFIARTSEFTPPVIYSLEERSKLVFLIEARPERPELLRVGQPVSVSLPQEGQGPVTTSARHRHRRRRPDQVLRRPQGRAQSLDAGEARHHLRLPRSQRLRQDHHHPHAVRPAHAGRGPRHLPRLRHPHRGRRDQAPRRLHDPALQPLSGPLGAREPGIRRPPLWARQADRRRARHDRADRARRPRGAARRRALRRLEAAARARRLHLAQPAAAAARRADRGRRSQGAARVLERDPRARRRGAHGAGLHPLHGRGRALSRDRLHRLWRAAGARHRGRGDRAPPISSPTR